MLLLANTFPLLGWEAVGRVVEVQATKVFLTRPTLRRQTDDQPEGSAGV